MFLTSRNRAKESTKKFFSTDNFFLNICWCTMNNVIGSQVMKFQCIAPKFLIFIYECILIQIIGNNNNYLGCEIFEWACILTSCIFFFLRHFGFFGSGPWSLSYTICAYKIIVFRESIFCIIHLMDCLFTWLTCILKTIKIPTTILIVWGWPIQTNIKSVHA